MLCRHHMRVGLCAFALAITTVSANEPEAAVETPVVAPVERHTLSSRSDIMAVDLARQLSPQKCSTSRHLKKPLWPSGYRPMSPSQEGW